MDVLRACLFSSSVWPRFKRYILFRNMRLERVDDPIERQHMIDYDNMVQSVGENIPCAKVLIQNEAVEIEGIPESDTSKEFILACVNPSNIFQVGDEDQLQNEEAYAQAIRWLYPDGYEAEVAAKNVVLATTNKIVDDWNDRIAALNPAAEHAPLVSVDKFTHVDDDNGYLKTMITDAVLEKYNSNDVPPHILYLKVGDVCLIMRNINVSDGVANNMRVKILKITSKYIRCQTLGDDPVHITLPRIRFTFRLPYGRSFDLTRLQFPLRRAFAISFHKSQGQTLGRCLLDMRSNFFAHGHLYVGLSRVTHFLNVATMVTTHQTYFRHPMCCDNHSPALHGKPLILNIVYPEAIKEVRDLRLAYQGRIVASIVSPAVDGDGVGGAGAGGVAFHGSRSRSTRRPRSTHEEQDIDGDGDY